jgi:hypothetical protein
LAYAYDYYLGGKRDVGEGKSVLDILKEAKPPISAKYQQFMQMTETEIAALEGRDASMYSNKKFMKYIMDLEAFWEGGQNNILRTFDNANQDTECLYGVWTDS